MWCTHLYFGRRCALFYIDTCPNLQNCDILWAKIRLERAFYDKFANKKVINDFNQSRVELFNRLIGDLYQKLSRETSIDKSNLTAALDNRILVYNGGGSSFPSLTVKTGTFTAVVLVEEEMWKNENVKEKEAVASICHLLNTSYGLSVGKNDERIPLCEFSELFGNLRNDKKVSKDFVDKDMC